MGEEVIAVAFEIVANEAAVITVGDEADALGEKRILDLDFFQADRPLLAGNFGEAGEFIHQIALAHAAHREGELRPERQTVHDRSEGKADQRGGK